MHVHFFRDHEFISSIEKLRSSKLVEHQFKIPCLLSQKKEYYLPWAISKIVGKLLFEQQNSCALFDRILIQIRKGKKREVVLSMR